jgi:uncharacterized Zn finger protein
MARRPQSEPNAELDLRLSARDVWLHFDPKTSERGFRYFEKGNVLSCGAFDGAKSVYGKVQGGGDNVYEVNLTLRPRSVGVALEGLCSCPVGHQCKHAAALAFKMLEQLKFVQTDKQELPPNAKRWLGQLKKTVRTHKQPHKAQMSDEYIGYVLSYGRGWYGYTAAHIHAVVAKKLKRGGLGAEKTLDIFALLERKSDMLTDQDKRIIDCFGTMYSGKAAAMVELPDDASLAAVVMERLLATSRLHFDSIKNPPLVAAGEEEVSFRWAALASGAQTVKAVVVNRPEAKVLWSHAPWYVDQHTWECGPLSLSIPMEVAEMLMSAPPVDPAHATAFNIALKSSVTICSCRFQRWRTTSK